MNGVRGTPGHALRQSSWKGRQGSGGGLFVWTFSAAFNGTLLILKFIHSWDAVMSVSEGPRLTHARTHTLKCYFPKEMHRAPAAFSARRRVFAPGKCGERG